MFLSNPLLDSWVRAMNQAERVAEHALETFVAPPAAPPPAKPKPGTVVWESRSKGYPRGMAW
jgi:hypothetical protein